MRSLIILGVVFLVGCAKAVPPCDPLPPYPSSSSRSQLTNYTKVVINMYGQCASRL